MKHKKLFSISTMMLTFATVLSTQISQSACIWWMHQPKEPIELKNSKL